MLIALAVFKGLRGPMYLYRVSDLSLLVDDMDRLSPLASRKLTRYRPVSKKRKVFSPLLDSLLYRV